MHHNNLTTVNYVKHIEQNKYVEVTATLSYGDVHYITSSKCEIGLVIKVTEDPDVWGSIPRANNDVVSFSLSFGKDVCV